VETAHVRVSKKFFRKPALNFRSQLFYDQIISRIHGQFHKFKRRGEPLQIDDTDKSNRFSLRRKKGEHIILFDPAQIPDVDIVATILLARLIPQGDHLSAKNASIVK
jgi:hypothetical protein